MKVLVVGFPKTGTNSMTVALSKLGYRVLEFEETFSKFGKDWTAILTTGGSVEDFRRIYKDVDATCDIPASLFWEELLEAFPDMKMIFTKRNSEEEWLQSWEGQVKAMNGSFLTYLMTIFSPTMWRYKAYENHLNRVTFCGQSRHIFDAYGGISPIVARKRYRDHNTAIVTRAATKNLLIFNMSDGWEPLCKFLEKPVPGVPFPHKNKRGEIVEEQMETSPLAAKIIFEMKIGLGLLAAFLAIVSYYIYLVCF